MSDLRTFKKRLIQNALDTEATSTPRLSHTKTFSQHYETLHERVKKIPWTLSCSTAIAQCYKLNIVSHFTPKQELQIFGCFPDMLLLDPVMNKSLTMFQELHFALALLSPGAQGGAALFNKVWERESASGQRAQNYIGTQRTELHRLREGQLKLIF